MSRVIIVKGEDPNVMIEKASRYFTKPFNKKIILKPNLIIDEPPPTTTPYETIEALVKHYLKFGFEVIIAEGSGWCNTYEAYQKLGYLKLKEKYGIKLVDINNDDFEIVKNPNAFFLKEFEFPLTLKDAYIISVPVLKEHSITKVTLSLKNMLGATISNKTRVAKKGRFHESLDESIIDINLYIKPRLAIIDGRIAGLGGELKARPKKLNIMIFSEDLVAADSVGASYFGKTPLEISHLKLAQKAGLGIADLNKIEVIEISG